MTANPSMLARQRFTPVCSNPDTTKDWDLESCAAVRSGVRRVMLAAPTIEIWVTKFEKKKQPAVASLALGPKLLLR